jgi:S1-C subfamily serine protease
VYLEIAHDWLPPRRPACRADLIFSPTGGSVGIGFAIPSEEVKSVIAQLKEKGSVTRGWLAMQFQSVTAERCCATFGRRN